MIVVADTSPINYLVQLEYAELLQAIYGEVSIPSAVIQELGHPGAPTIVRMWAERIPRWMNVSDPKKIVEFERKDLDLGEQHAISLALEISAGLLLADDQAARMEAARFKLETTGTLGVLLAASRRGLVDGHAALARLTRETSFYVSDSVRDVYLNLLRS